MSVEERKLQLVLFLAVDEQLEFCYVWIGSQFRTGSGCDPPRPPGSLQDSGMRQTNQLELQNQNRPGFLCSVLICSGWFCSVLVGVLAEPGQVELFAGPIVELHSGSSGVFV